MGEELPANTVTKTEWACCSQGHRWRTTCVIIASDKGCPYCAERGRRDEEDYHRLAAERRITWVGEALPRDTHAKTTWECQQGHRWETTCQSVRRGCRCPECRGEERF